jgi:hypothetical protein
MNILRHMVTDDIREDKFIDAVRTERAAQDAEWGGADHDDEHGPRDWMVFILKQLGAAAKYDALPSEFKDRMVKIAALACAAWQACDRGGQE